VVQVPTDLSPNLNELIDFLGLQTLNNALFVNGFNFMPMVSENDFLLMAPLPLPLQFFSTDPGLNWTPLPPPIQALLPPWPGEQLGLHLQALIVDVNGTLVPVPVGP
jgi:hypothetical protein